MTIAPIASTDGALLELLVRAVHANAAESSLARAVDHAIYLTVPGNPVTWHRPRQFQGRYITSKEKRQAVADLAAVFTAAVPARPWYANVAVVSVFFMADRRRLDRDNLDKLVMDAATKAQVWQDDAQSTRGLTLVECDPLNPRTLIALCPTTSTLDRTVPIKQRRGLTLPLTHVRIARSDDAAEEESHV